MKERMGSLKEHFIWIARPTGKLRPEGGMGGSQAERAARAAVPWVALGWAPHVLGGAPPAGLARVRLGDWREVRGLQRRHITLRTRCWGVLKSEHHGDSRQNSLNF